jgi:lipoprotein NlpI
MPEDERKAIDAEQKAMLAKCDAFLKEHPESVGALSSRGDAKVFLADWKGAEADYEKMIALDPKQDAPHWRLGIVYFFLGKYGKGAEQFAKYHAYDARDRENGVWHYFCLAKEKSPAEARKAMLAYTEFDRHPFPDVYELLAGAIKPEELTKRQDARHAEGGRKEQQQFFADLYLGMNAWLEGEGAKAMKHLDAATANPWGRVDSEKTYMWQVARLLRDAWEKEEAAKQKPAAPAEAKKEAGKPSP